MLIFLYKITYTWLLFLSNWEKMWPKFPGMWINLLGAMRNHHHEHKYTNKKLSKIWDRELEFPKQLHTLKSLLNMSSPLMLPLNSKQPVQSTETWWKISTPTPPPGIPFCFEGKIGSVGFPGGSVVKNPPANAGDAGSIPGPGRSHMLQSNRAPEPQVSSPGTASTEAWVP